MPILDYGQFELEPINNTDTNIQDLKKLRRLKFAQEQQSTYGRSVVEAPSQYGESKFDSYITLPQLEDLDRVRGERQPWYEQAGAMLNQAVVGSVVGQTIESIGTLLDIPDIIAGDYSMDNPVYNLGKSITDWAAETTPIYQTGDRFSDTGYWFQGLTSAASAASFLLPGWGITKALELGAKGLKLGTTATRLLQTSVGAIGMRHMEGAMEAEQVHEQLMNQFNVGLQEGKFDNTNWMKELKANMNAEIEALPIRLPNPETGEVYSNEDAIASIREKYRNLALEKGKQFADEGARLTYISDYSNLMFDVVQLGAVLKPFSGLTRNVKVPLGVAERQAELLGKAAKPWYGKLGYRMLDASKTGLAELTEGIEEGVNYIASQEGQRHGEIQMGLREDDGTEFGDRLSGYVGDEEFTDSFIFGAIGGVGFKALGRAIGMDEGKSIVDRKNAEISARGELVKERVNTVKDILSNPDITPEDKKSALLEVADDLGNEIGLRGAMAGNMDLVEEWLNSPQLNQELTQLGFGDETSNREVLAKVKESALNAENLYKKYYTGLYQYQMSDAARNIMIANRMSLDQQILENDSKLKDLNKQYTELVQKDAWFLTKGQTPQNFTALNQFATQLAIAGMELQMAEETNPEAKSAMENIIKELNKQSDLYSKELETLHKQAKELKLPFETPTMKEISGVDKRIINNLSQSKVLTLWNKELGNKLADKNTKEQIDKDIKESEEKVNKTKEEIINREKENKIKAEEEKAKAAVIKKWNKTIDRAVNDKELDSIIDQMDKAGVTTNELLDRVAQKRESLKITPKQPASETELSYENKIAGIERRRKENPSVERGVLINFESGKTKEQLIDIVSKLKEGKITYDEIVEEFFNLPINTLIEVKEAFNEGTLADKIQFGLDVSELSEVQSKTRSKEEVIKSRQKALSEKQKAETALKDSEYKIVKKKELITGKVTETKVKRTVEEKAKYEDFYRKIIEDTNKQIEEYDAELKALEQDKIETDTVNVITNSTTYDSNTGDNPPTVDDSNIEINEVNTRDFKRVQAVGLAYRASKFAVKGADAKKITISYEDIDPITLSLSDWNTLQNGDEVELSLDTEFDGNVQVYDNNRRVLNSDGTPLTEKKTYSEIPDEDKPIKVQITKNGIKTTVGYLFTESWAKAITPKGDKFENIANEDDMEGNAEIQIAALKKLRAEILKQGADKVHKFKVRKSHGHLAVTTETEKIDGKTRKINKPVNEALPKFAESDYFEGDYQPLAIWSGSEFVIGTNRVFPREAIAISDESWEELTTNRNNRYNGGVFILVPTAVRGKFIPAPVNIPAIDSNIVDSIIFAINANINKDTETSTKIFNNTGIDTSTRNGLRQFMSQYIYLSSAEAKGISRGVPRIVFSVADSRIEVWNRGEQTLVIDLNNPKNRAEKLEQLKDYLTLQRITVKSEHLNSNKKFGVPSIKTNEEGKQYIDFETTTFNKYAMDRLTTDLVELNTTDGTPIYMIQPTIDFIGDITVEPTTPTPTTPVTPDDFGDLPEGFFDDVLLTQVGKDTGVIKSENVEGIITPDAVGDEYGGDFSISEGIMSFLPLKGNEEIYKEYNLLSEDGKLKKLPDNAKTKKWVDTLNKSPYYQFRLRHLSDGTYRILIVNPYSDYSPAISEDYITPIKQGKQNIKQGVSELFESNPELATIGTQEQYSQYLDTIFPDSKVKDIVYHGTTINNLQSIIEKGFSKDKQRNTGFHLGTKEAANNAVISVRPAENRRIVPVIINSKNPERTADTINVDKDGDLEWQDKIQKAKGDSFIYENNREDDGKDSYVVFEPEQIHILGTKQDIEGFKQFVDNKNFAISEETVERVKELGKDLLVTDGDYTFGAGKQKQIVDNIKFLVYTDLLSLVKEGKRMAVSKAFSNAKESLIKTKKNIEFIANLTEEKFQQLLNNPKAKELYGHIESVEQAKYIASELERITKDEVFKQFEGQVVQDLKVLGITVKEEKLQDLSDEEKDDIVTDEDDAVDEEEQTQNVKSFSVEVFQVNPRNTAGINVKLMLSKIPNSNRNYLGLSSYIPFDTVFDDLTVALSPVEGSLKSYIQEMKNIINGNPAKSYLKNLVEVLESPETATSMKNQFVAVMNKHLGNFVLTLWKRTPNGMEVQTKYANENSAVSVIVNQWAENMGQSRIVTTDSKGNKHTDKTVAAELNDKIKQLQGKGKEAHKEFMLELFDALGIFIDPNIVDVLYNTTQYKELDPKGKRKGNFEYQFTYSSTGVPQGVFSAIVDALNKENSKEIIEAAEDLMQLNNPFDGANKNSSVTFLAQVVAKYSNVHYASSHRNVENKMIYDSSFHIPITSRIKDLNVPNSPTRAILKELPFSSTAYWLSDSAKNIKLIMHDMDGLKERGKNTDGVTRTSMSEREQEFTSIGLFQDTESEHTAKFIGMTMSDKSRTPIIEAPKFKVNINTTTLKDRHITKETLTEDSKEQISNLVKAEAARIRNIRQRIKEDIDNKLKNEVGEQYYNGAQFFYFFPELNGLVYKDGKLDDTMLLNENLQVLIDTALDKVVETVNNTIDKWWNIGIVYRDKKNRIATMFNKNYVSNSHLKDNALIAYAATDIELNYIVFNANMMQLVQGDPAKFYNQKKVGKFDVVTRISKVMDEYQKREAKDAAPGEIGTADWEFTDKNGIVRKGRPTYNVVFAADDKFGSITQGYLQTMPSYTEGLDRTDAQELTTLREHIDLLMNHGRIPDDIYASIMKKIEDAGVGGYYELTYDELGMVLGPQKPVQIVSRFDNGVESTFYIKSSSYPLIPQLTRGFGEDSDIEKIRVNMEKNNVDRLAFITATKIGARNTVELFKDGKVVEDLDFSDKLNQLSRKGFTIQQDVPYDPKKHEIVVISQMDRLLMQGLSDVEFEFKGKKLLGKELKKIKENLRGQLMDMSKEDIFDRMGIEMVDGNPVVRNLDKLISILREEAIDRKWAVNDIMALQIVGGNLVIPLAFNNSAERVETLISSLFTKIIKQKISGKSFVQASSSGYKNNTKTLDDLTASDKKGIVFLKGTGNDFNPKTGLTYTNLNEETKEVKVAQVFIPWKYSGNLEDFVKEGTSELDLNKIDPELLKMIGARIPNQGHSSQIVLQVVGFLPKVLGDLVIVPGEITKQMGSDFDVDKLYTYMYNNVVNAEGRLVKVPSAISENGDIDTKSLMDWAKDNFAKGKLDFGALSELDEDTDKKIKEGLKLAGLSKKALIKAALQNAYIEVHETVLTNSEVVKKALTPLDADDLSITGDNASTKQDRGLFISRDRQLKDFIRQQAGKSGVAIMSRAVVGGAMIEDYNLRLGTPTEKGYKDTPFKGFLDDSGDAIALINLSGEGKTEFNGEERTKTRNTIIMQSGAVDNANKPVLDSNNLNSFTFNTAIAINRLSSEEGRILDLRYTSYFLNQEVIKDYINELKSLSDTLNEEFTADRKNAAVEKVKENYLKRAGLKEYKVVGKGFTPQMMLDLIKSNEKNSNEYIKDQLEILEHFVYLDTVGTELNEIYGALSTESKGVGKGYWDVLIRQEQLRKLGRKSTISGAAELLEEGSQANKIAGYVYDAVKVMSQIFPYQTTQVQEIINTIEIYAGKTYTDKNLRQLIWENIKSYIFTHPDLATTPEDRNALFYGENSVAKEIERFKKTPEGFNNRFMQRVRTKLGKTADMPDLVLLNASAAERTDEQEVVKHFVDLLTSPNEGTRELGERLIQYQFATGGLQKALQYVKYIPVSYLATTNFGTKLMEIINSLNDENSININAFIEQFYQHNPARARIYKEEVTDKILNEGIKFNVETDRVNNLLYTKDNVQDYVPYISIRDKKGNWVLLKKERYEGITLVYKPIAVLGGHGKDYTSYNEYKFDTENVVSTIESNNPKNTILPQSKIVPTTKEEPTITNTEVYTVKGNKYVNPLNASPSENLNFAMANLETERFKALAPLFTKNSNLLSDKFEIIIDNNLEYTDSEGNKRPARGLYYKGKVYLNPKVINNNVKTQGRELTTEDIEKTLMHELGHAYTADLYRIYSEGGTHKLLTSKVKQNFERIDALRNVAYNMLTKEEKEKVNKIKTGKYGTPEQGINNEDLKTYYGFINTKEFISEVLTKPEFQKKLNEMSLNSTTSVFERVVKFIREIYNEFIKTLGFTVKQNSVLENSLLEVMDLIHNSENVEKIIESKISNIKDKIEFKEEQTSGYRNRTIKNASADATIAMAIDFNSAGEKLTKSSVLSQNKKYIPVDANKLEVTEQRVNNIVNSLNSINKQRNLFDNNGISLNIAGNGLYTMKGKYTQEQIDEFTYQLLKAVVESPNLKNKIEFIRTGGQTGFDEAGAKAGIRLGIPTTILAPKGWVFRDINGRDISNEQQFKNRFNIEITTNKEETLPSISEISNKEVSLQMSVGDYMKTLTKEQRELLRNLVDQKIIEFRCK